MGGAYRSGFPQGMNAEQFMVELGTIVDALASPVAVPAHQGMRIRLAWDLWASKLPRMPNSAAEMVDGLTDYMICQRAPVRVSRKLTALAVSMGSDRVPPAHGVGADWLPIRLTRVWARTYHLPRNAPAAAAKLYQLPGALGRAQLGKVSLCGLAYSTEIPEVAQWADSFPLTLSDRVQGLWDQVRSAG